MARRRAANTAASLLRLSPTCLNSARLSGSNGVPLRHLSVCARRRPHHQPCSHDQPQARRDGGRRSYAAAKTDHHRVAVVGGGLTGLTTAYYLAKLLPPTAQITLYESSGRLGGWVQTDRLPVNVGGKRGTVAFERGPRTLPGIGTSIAKFDDLVLCDLMLDLGLQAHAPPRAGLPRYIYYPDHPVKMPPTDVSGWLEPLVLEAIVPALGMFWKIALSRWGVKSLILPERDLSVSEWMHSLSGTRTGWDSPVSAMLNGIYGGDIDKLSARSVFDLSWRTQYQLPPEDGKFWAYPWDQRLWETMSKDPQVIQMRQERSTPIIHLGESGMEGLTQAMAHALEGQANVTIKLKEPVTRIAYDEGSDKISVSGSNARGLTEDYDKVIATLTGPALASVTDRKLPTLAQISSVSIMVVSVWYPEQSIKKYPGLGYLIPRTIAPELNPECALGVFFDSDVGLVGPDEPSGTKLTVLMGGHYYGTAMDPPSEEQAVQQAKAVLERHLGIPRDQPCFATARLAQDCIPQHNVGHHDRLAQAHADLANHFRGRLAVAGGTYTRNGVVASLRAGHDVARDLAEGAWSNTGLGRPAVAEMVPMSLAEVRGPDRQR